MDRLTRLNRLYDPGVASMGVKVIEAPDPQDLTTETQAAIDAFAASGEIMPFVHGFELAGGGGGDSARVILTMARSLGWGLMTAMPASRARAIFKRAQNAAEIETVLVKMYAAIAAAATYEPNVWQPRIVGTGRDGSYLIGILWCDGEAGILCRNQESFAASGPYTTATTILTVTIPQTLAGIQATDSAWHVTWGMIVEDVAGTKVKTRLELNAGSLWESEVSGGAGIWQPVFGQYNHYQDPAGASLFALIVEPNGGNQVNVRGCSLRAELAQYPDSPS